MEQFTFWCSALSSPSVFNMLLLLPHSVGSGGERRLAGPAFPHEQNYEEDPQQEEQEEVVTGRRKTKH